YVIYTSGTTGQPKGVMMAHVGIINRLHWMKSQHLLAQSDVVLQKTPYIFDVSLWELLGPTQVGACIIIASPNIHTQPEALYSLILEKEVTALDFVPSMLRGFCQSLAASGQALPASVRRVFCGGEALTAAQVDDFYQVSSNSTSLYHMYGPTEAAIDATFHECSLENAVVSPPLGKGVDNTQVYVLNGRCCLVPIGTQGELYLSGAGLARGYLNRPELTVERFIENPFATEKDIEKGYTRLYKTGDLVRYLPDGNLEYVGRNDEQVKIRGHRIELGEIQAALERLGGIKQAVVIDYKTDNSHFIAAYIVPDMQVDSIYFKNDRHSLSRHLVEAELSLEIEGVKQSLAACLPDYMLPTSFTVIDEVPLTINGKLDKKALPEPMLIDTGNYSPPRNELEQQLCHIWQAVLGLDKVGIHDNFFRIGGDSIVSIQLVSRLRKIGFNLQVKAIFDAPTVSQLAAYLAELDACAIEVKAEQETLLGEFALLPIQQWFFDIGLANPNHFNQSFMLSIPNTIAMTTLDKALLQLSKQHDMLRVVFKLTDDGYRQSYTENSTMAPLVAINVFLLDDEALNTQLTDLQASLDIGDAKLWQVVYLRGYEDDTARLCFILHHLIVDAVSWRIIADDMAQLLTGKALGPKTSSYRQWVQSVADYGAAHVNQVDYWQEQLWLSEQISYPTVCTPSHHSIQWSEAVTSQLLHESPRGYYTEINDLLLSALAVALKHLWGKAQIAITLEGHGREVIDESIDISHTLGWFTTVFPIILNVKDELSDTIIDTKERLRAIPDKGLGFGALKIDMSQLPPVSFNYLGQLNQTNNSSETEDASSLWQLTAEEAGLTVSPDNIDDNLLNINGAIIDACLCFDVQSQLSQTQSLLFTHAFKQALIDVVSKSALQAQTGGIHTPSDYAVSGLTLERLNRLHTQYDIETLFSANSLQQGFIAHGLTYPDDDAYCVQLLLDYQAQLDIDCYQEAWRLASLRYPALRIAFDWDGAPLQIITRGASIDKRHFNLVDLTHLDEVEREVEIISLQQKDRAQGFDLTQPGLIRFTLIKQQEALWSIIKTEHHSISDGWSAPVLWQFVYDTYQALIQSQRPKIEAETSYLQAQAWHAHQQSKVQAYWSDKRQYWQAANDIGPLLSHKVDLETLKTVNSSSSQELCLEGEALERLKAMCQAQGITLNVAVQFAWHKILQVYTQDEQTIVGTTVSGRNIPVEGIETSVGLHINTLPLVVNWKNDETCAEVLQQIQHNIFELNSYSSVSLAGLQTQGERLFHSLLVFENYPMPIHDAQNVLCFRKAIEKTDYPLSITAYEQSNALIINISYEQSIIEVKQIKRLLQQMQRLFEQVSEQPTLRHQALSLLSDDERHTLLHEWNQTDTPYPQDKTLQQLFEAQVEKTPNNVALVFEGEELTYHELNQ
ncbi:condensation domain-containing protein, partial [uncultured Shewanella sp.]|uniref:condensation domain-containing protein n=1 Tax=uncultured Shewanella sp. TaxID=173975 RepID=UPI00261F9066